MQSEKFGRLLKGAIGSIVTHEGKTAPVVEDELGEQIGLTAASIQRYKAGHIPPDFRTIEIFAAAAVKRGYLNREWLYNFLQTARYPYSEKLLDELCPATPPPLPATLVYHNLPAPTYANFVMREQAYAEIVDGLRQRSAVVLIVSIGGMGKSSLAREIAADCLSGANRAPRFDAAVWVSDKDYPGTTSLNTVLDEIAFTLDYPGFAQLEPASKRREVENLLRRHRVLLVVDNFETINDANLTAWLLRLPEPSKAIVTSREYRREFQRSSWPIELGGLSATEAHQLLNHKLRQLKIEKLVGDISQLAPLLTATGGNPKAIEIALGFLKYGRQSVTEIIGDLQQAHGAVFDDLFARCWQLLDDETRRVLLATAFFVGSAPSAALLAVAGVETATFDRALERLTDLAMLDVQKADLDSPPRYSLHPLVRAFVSARLPEQPAFETAARERLLDWAIGLATKVGYCWDDLDRLKLLDPEQDTIHTVLTWAWQNGYYAKLLQLTQGVDYYYFIRGLWSKEPRISWLRVVAAQKLGKFEEETKALAYHIQMLCRQAKISAAEELISRLKALSTLDLPDDTRFEVQYTLGMYLMTRADFAAALAVWQATLSLAARVSVRAYAVNRGRLAICLYSQGETEAARQLWTAIVHDAEVGGFRRGVVSSQIGLVKIELDKGQLANVQALLDAASNAAHQYQDRGIIAEINRLFARYYALSGDFERSRLFLAKAIDTFERLGMHAELAETRTAI